ncbi:CvpA family protein, partial [Pseudoalteromonas sp. SYSU M81241]
IGLVLMSLFTPLFSSVIQKTALSGVDQALGFLFGAARGIILVAVALLVFVDCAKELPATLLLRPLNVETLATHLYGEAARGTY